MSHNTFGHLFRVTTWGESHGPAIGCVVDGCPPRIPISEAEIQQYLDKRRPGQSRFTTQRREPDKVAIMSGVFADETSGRLLTTGTPISLVIENVDAPVIVDAGVGTASDAAIAMELGCDAVLMNTAIAAAGDPVRMASAMRKAVDAGRDAYLAARMPKRSYVASPSSPTEGLIQTPNQANDKAA